MLRLAAAPVYADGAEVLLGDPGPAVMDPEAWPAGEVALAEEPKGVPDAVQPTMAVCVRVVML